MFLHRETWCAVAEFQLGKPRGNVWWIRKWNTSNWSGVIFTLVFRHYRSECLLIELGDLRSAYFKWAGAADDPLIHVCYPFRHDDVTLHSPASQWRPRVLPFQNKIKSKVHCDALANAWISYLLLRHRLLLPFGSLLFFHISGKNVVLWSHTLDKNPHSNSVPKLHAHIIRTCVQQRPKGFDVNFLKLSFYCLLWFSKSEKKLR